MTLLSPISYPRISTPSKRHICIQYRKTENYGYKTVTAWKIWNQTFDKSFDLTKPPKPQPEPKPVKELDFSNLFGPIPTPKPKKKLDIQIEKREIKKKPSIEISGRRLVNSKEKPENNKEDEEDKTDFPEVPSLDKIHAADKTDELLELENALLTELD